MQLLGALLGVAFAAAVPAGTLLALRADPVSVVALLAGSAALNALWPLGGGMVVDGAFRTRWWRWEWTFDAHRTRREALLGPGTLAAATLGGFVVLVPPLALGWWLTAPSGLSGELSAVGTLVALVLVGWLRHRPELPYAQWLHEAGEGLVPAMDWAARVRSMEERTGADGALGSVGGIGAGTVGLHEHLDALELLERLEEAGVPGAADLRSRGLGFLQTRREAAGFPVYPGAAPRERVTARAEAALARASAPPSSPPRGSRTSAP